MKLNRGPHILNSFLSFLFAELYLFGKKNLLSWGEFLVEYFTARNI
jgi:hypothetical protein